MYNGYSEKKIPAKRREVDNMPMLHVYMCACATPCGTCMTTLRFSQHFKDETLQ